MWLRKNQLTFHAASFLPGSQREEQHHGDRERDSAPADDYSRGSSRHNQSSRDQSGSRRDRSNSRGRSSREDRQARDARPNSTSNFSRYDASEVIDRRPRNREDDNTRERSRDLDLDVGSGQQQPDSNLGSRKADQDQQESRGGQDYSRDEEGGDRSRQPRSRPDDGHARRSGEPGSNSGGISNRRDRPSSTVFVRVSAAFQEQKSFWVVRGQASAASPDCM